MTITTTLKARDAELRRLETNRERIVRNLGRRLDGVSLTARFDGGVEQTLLLSAVLDWREWGDAEIGQLASLVTGEMRRFSTIDPHGNLCDLELAR